MEIFLDTWCQDDCTTGRLRAGAFQCFTLELPWLNNKPGESCIPEGRYPVTRYTSPSKGHVLLLHNVPKRSYIEIHAGNFTRQIEGCILVGKGITLLDADSIPDVTNSRDTLSALLKAINEPMYITVKRTGEYA